MHRSQPYRHGSQRFFRAASWCSVLLTTAVVLMPPGGKSRGPVAAPSGFSAREFLASAFTSGASLTAEESVLPSVLAAADVARYQFIFSAQKQANWTAVDAVMGELENDVLQGYVLAERYLSAQYRATAAELANWLSHYADHPQAPDIYARAVALNPSLRRDLPPVKKLPALAGYGDEHGMASGAYDTPYQGSWRAGLASWRNGRKAEAARYFASVAEHSDAISPWMASAAAYWAHRAHDAAGHAADAARYLAKAAQYPRSFYGILARRQLDMPLGLDAKPVELTDSDILHMVGDQSVRRIVALTEAGYNDLAEKELRIRFPQAEDDEKPRLLALARALGLASVQISMAQYLGMEGRELDFARYPIPSWKPEGGYTVDPLLLFSLMRQESGFRQSAVSPVGALGLMQLMPGTASLMHKRIYGSTSPERQARAAEPVQNITLGQNYVEHLLTHSLVGGNLFYLLAAYNAGPGRLQDWKASLNYRNDPLLFVESIPFSETRSYVMQVMANYWIYSELTGGDDQSAYAVLKGRWPAYASYGTLAAAAGAGAGPGSLKTGAAAAPGA